MKLPQKRSLGGGGLCPLLKPPPHMKSSSWSLGGGGLFPHQKDPLPPLGRTDAGRPAADARQPSASRGLGPRFSPSSGTRTPPGRPAPSARLPSAQARAGGAGTGPCQGQAHGRCPAASPPLHACPLPRAGWERGPRSTPSSGALTLSFCT